MARSADKPVNRPSNPVVRVVYVPLGALQVSRESIDLDEVSVHPELTLLKVGTTPSSIFFGLSHPELDLWCGLSNAPFHHASSRLGQLPVSGA